MSQSLSKLYVHLTFGTKYREPLINDPIAADLHAYLASILKEMDSPALIINSMPDHIHALFNMSKNVALSRIVEEIKKCSSKWIKTQPGLEAPFYWQRGYGAFSVSSRKPEVVARYIQNQKEHHKQMTYKEEIELFMKKFDVIEYFPEYYWD